MAIKTMCESETCFYKDNCYRHVENPGEDQVSSDFSNACNGLVGYKYFECKEFVGTRLFKVIRLSTINDVKDFIAKTEKYEEEILLICGKYCVDAKSILGVFSLNLLEDLTVTMTPQSAESRYKFEADFECFESQQLGN